MQFTLPFSVISVKNELQKTSLRIHKITHAIHMQHPVAPNMATKIFRLCFFFNNFSKVLEKLVHKTVLKRNYKIVLVFAQKQYFASPFTTLKPVNLMRRTSFKQPCIPCLLPRGRQYWIHLSVERNLPCDTFTAPFHYISIAFRISR